ncbi:MAG: hypothetical protein ACNS60_03220 [Candidatus Cyclobacteriaceae bacterium M2_1C_046]
MYRYIKIYSIDIALGAVVVTWFLGEVARVSIPWQIYLIISLAVWSIYTIDHLLDAKKLGDKTGPERYSLHQTNVKAIIILVGLAMGTALFFAFTALPGELLYYGFILSGFTLVYFLLRLFLKILFSGLKELMAAIIYTAGVAIPSYHFMESFDFYFFLVVLQLFCLVFGNLLICAIWDENWDRTNAYDSMAVLFGRRFINKILLSLIAIALISASAGFFIYSGFYLTVQFIILLMGLGLILIYYFAESKEEVVQRLLVDSIFFIPLLLFLL